MNRAILLAAIVFATLFVWDRSLARAADDLRSERTRVSFVLPEERRADLPVAAVKIAVPGEPEHFYGRVRGRWAALSYHRAEADAKRMAALLQSIAEAQGTIISEDPADAESYGLTSAQSIVVSFCGSKVLDDPSGDVLESFEIGRSLGQRGACFLRRRGSPAIWQVESDPRALLSQRVSPTLPPLLDASALPASWEGWTKGLVQMFIDRADGTSLALERRMRDPQADAPQQGEMPWRWFVSGSDRATGQETPEFAAAPPPQRGYELFLARIPYADVVNPKRAAELGLEHPVARITLSAPDTEPLVVLLGAATSDGLVPLFAQSLARLVLLEQDVARLVLPEAAWFSPENPQNPWDPYLR